MSHYYIDEVATLDSEYMRELIEAVILEERMVISSMAGDHVEFSVVDDPWLRSLNDPLDTRPDPGHNRSMCRGRKGRKGGKKGR